VGAVDVDPGGVGAAGEDRAAGRRRGVEHRDRGPGGGVTPDGDVVAQQVCAGRDGRSGRRAPLGSASDGGPGGDHHRDLRTPPQSLGVTHWSLRLLAARLETSNGTVAKAWREVGSSRGGCRPSSSAPTRIWSRRSPTSSGCTWRHRRTRWCSAWTRGHRSRRLASQSRSALRRGFDGVGHGLLSPPTAVRRAARRSNAPVST